MEIRFKVFTQKRLEKNSIEACVPSNFMANRRVPKFSLNNCAQSPKKTFMCPKFRTNPVLMYTKCHLSTNLSSFLKLCLLYCQKYLPLLRQIADSLKKISLVGTQIEARLYLFYVITCVLRDTFFLFWKKIFLVCVYFYYDIAQ